MHGCKHFCLLQIPHSRSINGWMPRMPLDDITALQKRTRENVRMMLRVTGWSLNKLAEEAGLAGSTLHRFMNKPVKHNLSTRTMSLLVFAALKGFVERIEDEKSEITYSDSEKFAKVLEDFIDLGTFEEEAQAGGDPARIKEAAELKAEMMDLIGSVRERRDRHYRKNLFESAPPPGVDVDELMAFINQRIPRHLSDDEVDQQAKAAAMFEFLMSKGGDRPPSIRGDLPVVMPALTSVDLAKAKFDGVKMFVQRPPVLADSPTSFAFFVVDPTNEPKYSVRDLVYVDPKAKPQPGKGAVLQLRDGSFRLGILEAWTSETVDLRYAAEPKIMSFAAKDVRFLGRVIGVLEAE